MHVEEHEAEDAAAQDEFAVRRMDVLAALKGVELPSDTCKFIQRNWSKRKMNGLDRRLRQLIQGLPVGVRNASVRHRATPSQRNSSPLAGPLSRLSSENFATPCPMGAATIGIWSCSLGSKLSRLCAERTPFGCSVSMTRASPMDS